MKDIDYEDHTTVYYKKMLSIVELVSVKRRRVVECWLGNFECSRAAVKVGCSGGGSKV